jgi:hypothetical protein
VAILLGTAFPRGNQSDALGGDTTPKRTTYAALNSISQRLRTQVKPEFTPKTLAHLSCDLVDLGLFSGGWTGWAHDQREVDVTSRATFSACDAAEDERLADMAKLREAAAEELLQVRLHLRLFAEESVDSRIQDVLPVQLIEVRTARPPHTGEADLGEASQHLGRPVMHDIRAPRKISCTHLEPVRERVERPDHSEVPTAGEDVIESISESHAISKKSWYL